MSTIGLFQTGRDICQFLLLPRGRLLLRIRKLSRTDSPYAIFMAQCVVGTWMMIIPANIVPVELGISGGILLLAGPVGDEAVSHELYYWDGNDGVPGTDNPHPTRLIPLGTMPSPAGQPQAKPEGIAVTSEDDSAWELILIYDGPAGGAPTMFRVEKP